MSDAETTTQAENMASPAREAGEGGMPKNQNLPEEFKEPPEPLKHPDDEEEIRAKEYAATGGQASKNPIQDILDEGTPVDRSSGELRGDQTTGHRGGGWRPHQDRGRT